MRLSGTLFLYEYKKILHKKIVWISTLLCLIALVFSVCSPLLGTYYIDGKRISTNYQAYQTDKAYAAALNGRALDQELLEEAVNAYRKIPQVTGNQHYTSTPEYQTYARPYSPVFNFIGRTTDLQPSEIMMSWTPDETDLYERRQKWLTSLWEDFQLTTGEMDFWQKQEDQVKKPVIYQETGGWENLFSDLQTVGILVLMVIAISLSGIFSDEHLRKTDQLILSSSLGKTKLYQTKIAAGIAFSVSTALLFIAVAFLLTLLLFGADGFHAAFQLVYPRCSEPLTCGQATLIAYGILLIVSVTVGIFVMILSELLRSNIAALSVITGILLSSMIISVPAQYRILAQLWDWLPFCIITPWNIFGTYTLSLFGTHLPPWQAAPLLYLTAAVIIVFLGKPFYRRFQISGR